MRYRVTLILLTISTVLSIWIYSLEKRDSRKSGNASYSVGLFGPDILLADRLELRGPALGEGEERMLRRRDSGQWQIEKPMNWPANFYIVNQVLNQIQFLPKEYSFTVESSLKKGKTLGDYGLQEPRLELALGWGGRKHTVAFGQPTEMGGKTYLLGPERRNIYAVSQQLESSLLQKLEFWRSQEIFTLSVIEVGSISLDINDSGNLTKIRLEKTGDAWKLEAPIKAPADTALVNERINVLQGVKALRFLRGKDGQEAREALLKPFIRITLHGATQGQTLELAEPLAEAKPFLYAKFDAYPTTYFIVSDEPFANLRRAQTYFRQKQFLDFAAKHISGIRIRDADNQVSLQKLEQGDWQVQEPGEARWLRAEKPIIMRLLDSLAKMEALSFPHDAPSQEDLQRLGLESPMRTIILLQGQDTEPRTLHFGQPEGGEALYAKLSNIPYVYEVEPSLAESLDAHPLHYRNRRLFPDNPVPAEATLKQLKIYSLPDRESLLVYPEKVLEKSPETPQAPVPAPDSIAKELEKARAALVLGLAGHLRDLRAKEFMPQGFQEKYFEGPDGQAAWRYQLEVTYKLPEGNDPAEHTLTLLLTERIAGTSQGAAHAVSGTAFALRQGTIDLLHRILPGAEPPPEYRKPPEPKPKEPANKPTKAPAAPPN